MRALVWNFENLVGDAKGKGTSGGTVKPKVPMRQPGADCSPRTLSSALFKQSKRRMRLAPEQMS